MYEGISAAVRVLLISGAGYESIDPGYDGIISRGTWILVLLVSGCVDISWDAKVLVPGYDGISSGVRGY